MQGYFLSLSGSGAAPLKPRFFCLQGFICLFYPKNRLVYYTKYFIVLFAFFYFLEPFARMCKGLFSGKETIF
ncbi:hypothetical protein BREVNS_1032 [Brevinematales bacterium NS]|nr:hypothetical protein BREVNS_1032 [Brevinematales bacterium NS]